jgi:hypothetical protein
MLTSALVHVPALLVQEAKPNETLSWAVGGGALVFLLILLGALAAFGGGREHSCARRPTREPVPVGSG